MLYSFRPNYNILPSVLFEDYFLHEFRERTRKGKACWPKSNLRNIVYAICFSSSVICQKLTAIFMALVWKAYSCYYWEAKFLFLSWSPHKIFLLPWLHNFKKKKKEISWTLMTDLWLCSLLLISLNPIYMIKLNKRSNHIVTQALKLLGVLKGNVVTRENSEEIMKNRHPWCMVVDLIWWKTMLSKLNATIIDTTQQLLQL